LPENVTWRPISTEVLNAMTDDLHRIVTHATLHSQFPERELAQDRLLGLPPNRAWLYKPPQDHELKVNNPKSAS